MERSARIAVAGPVDDRLAGDIRQLPLRPEVRAVGSVVADSEALLRFQPDVLVLALGAEPSEEVGAVRLLRQLWPALGVVVATAPAQEVAATALAQRMRALVLVYPDAPGQLAAILEQARLQSDRPRADTFVDLARGVADEINNPLMFVSGHLQLLRANLQAPERDRRDQLGAALSGLARIEAVVGRLRALSQAANGPRTRADVDLAALLADALGMAPRDTSHAGIVVGEGEHVVRGDRDQLAAAVTAVLRFADELAAAGDTTQLALETRDGAQQLRVHAQGSGVASWQLPQTFEPYYPSRALRSQGGGLGLFLAQTVVLAHRGQAVARRLGDGALQLEFVLPA